MSPQLVVSVVIVFSLLMSPVAGWAQALSAGIAGVVTDASGAVLPGVTVEATSPALIEKVRVAVTDNQGNYKIVDLRPGAYTVTFMLPGFSTFKREGLELTTTFTATANAEMKVGALEETVTVSGVTPVVDVQNVRQQSVLTREVLDAVPTGKTLQAFAALLVGAALPVSSQDVGGNRGELVVGFGIHGSRASDMKKLYDGMNFNNLGGDNTTHYYMVNQINTQEVVLQTGSNTAEFETGGIQINVVPKDGGNAFTVHSVNNYTNPRFQNGNLTEALRLRGVTTPTPIKRVYDAGLGLGGPLKRDTLWFYTGHRWWGAAQTLGGTAGGFFNATQDSWFYTPDLSRPAYRTIYQRDNNIRVTWQVASKHKVNLSYYNQDSCTCFAIIEGRAPEAARASHYSPATFQQETWTFPATNRLLFDAGFHYMYVKNAAGPQPGVTPDTISVTELSTGLNYRAMDIGYGPNFGNLIAERFATSYVTGSHAMKAGVIATEGYWWIHNPINQDINYIFRNRVPQSIAQWTSIKDHAKLRLNLGLFAQDQWTTGRLTLNLGVRFDSVNAQVQATHQDAGRFVPARDFPQVDNVPNWKDVSPRVGAAYNLFGDGQTAIKVSMGRYLAAVATGIASANNPVTATVRSATRTWTDANGDFFPQEAELGPLSNSNFGKSVITTVWAPELLNGYGQRGYGWQGSASIQHELRPGMGFTAGYFRTWYGNFRVTDNLAVASADFDPYCITAPQDSRLPGGGGQQICGLYDIVPAKFGLVNNLVTQAAHYGKQTEVYNGFDLTMNARFGKGGLLSGGLNTGQTVTDNCAVLMDSPQARFCRNTLPFRGQTQVKFSGVYPLPWDLHGSATFQNLSSIPITASYVATNAQIAPALGRNLGQCRGAATCNGTAIVDLIEPNTLFEHRISQLDVRLAKTFRLEQARVQGMFDVYNLTNASNVLQMTTRYGAAWLQPALILGGRLFKFGVQIDY